MRAPSSPSRTLSRVRVSLTLALSMSFLCAACLDNAVSLGNDDVGQGPALEADGGVVDLGVVQEDAGPVGGIDLVVSAYPGPCPVSFQYEVPRFELTALNVGDQPSGPFEVALIACAGSCAASDPRQVLFSRRIEAGLTPGASQTIVEPMPALPDTPVGPWTIYFVADPDDEVDESIESNNQSPPVALHNGLRATPSLIDFGTTCVGAANLATVSVQNVGLTPAGIDGLLSIALSREIGYQSPAIPTTLAPGESLTLSASYAPLEAGLDEHMLLIEWDQSACPLVVLARGVGAAGPSAVETFVQRERPLIDVLAVIDDSCSMAEEAAAIQSNLPVLYDSLRTDDVDFHLGVTTTDVDVGGAAGRLLGTPAFLDPATPDGGALWAARFDVGTAGSGLDQGFEATRLGLSPPLSLADNAGFRRSGASLLVLYVSDEDDGSPQTVASYEAFLRGLPEEEEDLRVNAVTVVPGSNCGEASTRYLDLVSSTGGRVVDICGSDWSAALNDPDREGFGLQRSFQLIASDAPREADLEVRVNGNVVDPSGYQYDESTRVLRFEATAIPGPGVTIEVSHPTSCP